VSNSPDKDLPSLQRQLDEARENLRLIQERMAAFVLSTDVPLQLVKEERHWLDRVAELEEQLAARPAEGGMESMPEQPPDTQQHPRHPEQYGQSGGLRWALVLFVLLAVLAAGIVVYIMSPREPNQPPAAAVTETPTPIPPTGAFTPEPTPTWTPTSVPEHKLVQTIYAICSAQQFQDGFLQGGQAPYTYALFNDGTWERHPVEWKEGADPKYPLCSDDPRLQYGFGKFYCQYPDIAEKLGSPVDEGATADCTIKVYSDGALLPVPKYGMTLWAKTDQSSYKGTWTSSPPLGE